jgi:DNA-directed RNA polymerase subunit RPC12/RpoP
MQLPLANYSAGFKLITYDEEKGVKMIYFKCSQCGASMEAPDSLKGQLLACPKCGSHQTVGKENCLLLFPF